MNLPQGSVRGIRIITWPAAPFGEMRRFYEQVIGLQVRDAWDNGGGDHGLFLAGEEETGAEIELMTAAAAAEGVLPAETSGRWSLAVEVDDLDALLQRAALMNHRPVRPAAARAWGGRDALLRDPAGNLLLVFTR